MTGPETLHNLVRLEQEATYRGGAEEGKEAFVYQQGNFPILVSAPHGGGTIRKGAVKEEDEYTSAFARWLGVQCNVHAIAATSLLAVDPNHDADDASDYKQAIRQIVNEHRIQYLIDLHGASDTSKPIPDWAMVDLGILEDKSALPAHDIKVFTEIINRYFEPVIHQDNVVSINGFMAEKTATVTKFAHRVLGIHAVQVELKAQVRVVERLASAAQYDPNHPYRAQPSYIFAMLNALVDFIESLKMLPQ